MPLSDVNIPTQIPGLAIAKMPSVDRENSRDSERQLLRHQHSGSVDYGKAVVPMWDSSDPDRAPPPLPLNPSSPSLASRSNASAAIQSAHAALTERARENALVPNSVAKRIDFSPERSLFKGAAHKRMQSLHTGHVRDLSNFIEGGLSPTKSPERTSQRSTPTPTPQEKKKEEESTWLTKSPEKEMNRSVTPTSVPLLRDALHVRPSLRRPPQSILGENTPPQSATMLALQSMSTRDSRDKESREIRESSENRESKESDSPLANVTNNSSAMVRVPQTFDAISNQILSLTSIATSLQREMAQLNRRSKDNATDLVSLKEATNARDEDIRKSLRDLTSNLSKPQSQSPYTIRSGETYMLDDKPHTPLSRGMKTIALPRIPSPTSFSASLDRGLAGTPSSCFNPEGAATIALLEKVLREMGTKEGQELLVSRLAEIANRLARDGMETAKRMEEILKFAKENSGSRALVVNNSGGNNRSRPRNFSFEEAPKLELEDYDRRGSGPMVNRVENLLTNGANKENGKARAADIVNEDVLKIIKNIKDSVAQGGGLTAEVKALVRELRGEVLGMGREIGRKLEQASASNASTSAKNAAAESEQVARIIDDGLQDLKQHLDRVMREARRQSASSMASRNTIDAQEVYNAVKSALADVQTPGLAKEDVIDAVREAWENYKPDIEVQHFGLERDEMLSCLKEGIQEYMPQDLNRDVGATREEVFVAVVEGLKHFSPPRVETEASLSRDEILDAVRECLEEFEFPSAPAPEPRDIEITKADMLDAVKEGLNAFEFQLPPPPEPRDEITKEDMLDAVKEGLSSFEFQLPPPPEPRDVDITREDVVEAVRDGLSTFEFPPPPPPEFVEVTREAVLDAVREGLSTFEFPSAHPLELRGAEVTREDMFDAVREGLSTFEFPSAHALELRGVELTREDVLDAVREGLDTFEFPSTHALELRNAEITKEDVLDAVREGLSTFEFPSPPAAQPRDFEITREDVLDAVREGLSTFEVPSAPVPEPRDFDITREDVLDAVKEGLSTFEFPVQNLQGNELSRNVRGSVTKGDDFDDLKAESEVPTGLDGYGEQLLEGLHDVLETMRAEFRAVSDEAKQNVAAHGRDTEQVLDATKDGLDKLRIDIESYVDRAADVTGKDEILDCVRQGFESLREEIGDFVSQGSQISIESIKEELNNFRDAMATSIVPVGSNIDKDEIISTLRHGLEGLRADIERTRDEANVDRAAEVTGKDEIISTLRHGLEDLRADIEKLGDETNANRVDDVPGKDEIMDYMAGGFESLRVEIGQLMSQGSEISMESIKDELNNFRDAMATSIVPAGSSIDGDKIVSTLKEGLEGLRADIERTRDETNVSRAADVTGKDEIMDYMAEGFESLRAEIGHLMSQGSEISMESIKDELNNFRDAMATSVVPAGSSIDRDEIVSTLKEGLESLRADIERPRDSSESVLSGTGEILDALHDGLNDLKVEVERIGSKPMDMTVNYEILDTLKSGMEGLRADIDRLRENGFDDNSSHGDRDIAAITNGAVIVTDSLKRDDIENLEALITQLRIKVEALESMPPPPPTAPPDSVSREDIVHMEETMRNVQQSVIEMSRGHHSDDEESVRREDFEAIETLLRNTKAKIDDLDPEQTVKKDHLDVVEEIIRETRDSIKEILSHVPETAKQEDVNSVESLVKDVMVMLQDIKDVTENDGNIGVIVLSVKDQIDKMLTTDLPSLASKEDLTNLGDIVKELKDASKEDLTNLGDIVKGLKDSSAISFEDRQAEIVGVGERVSEVKTLLEDFRDSIKEKVEEGALGVDAISKVLDGLGPAISSNSNNITEDVKDLLETMKSEFERSNAGVVGAKLETDEKFAKTWEKLDDKFEELMLKYDDAQLAADAKAKAEEERSAATDAALLGTKTLAEELKLSIDTLGSTLTDSVDKMDEASKTVFNRVEDTYTKLEETHSDVKTESQLTREQVLKALSAVEDVQSNVSDYQPKILESIKDVLVIVGQHYEHSKTSTDTIQDTIKERDAASLSSVRGLLENVPDKYDDAPVQEKLNKLVDHMDAAGKSFAQLDMLEEIHRKVMQTAAEISEFVSKQTLRIANDHEDKVKEAEEAALVLERRLAEKERVEADVANQRAEEQRLKDSVAALRAEQEELAHQKMRLSADVSSLETALRIRREELQDMEARAEGLERRILEGVIDHSRAFLIGRTKGRDAMNLKRVPSHATSANASTMSTGTSRSRAAYTTQSAMDMAMNAPPRAIIPHPMANPAGASRRNFSLNQITNNIPGGGFKRSHSVKDSSGSGALRKTRTSWGGSLSRQSYGELNKENLALKESDEESAGESDGDVSDSGTLRRTSRGTMSTMTGTDISGGIDEGTEYSDTEGGYDDDEDSMGLVKYEPPA